MQPMQQLYFDKMKTCRFKENEIVKYLLYKGGIDMNKLAMLDFSSEDREQFAQLIGYSLSDYGKLSYVSDESFEMANKMINSDKTDLEVRCEVQENIINKIKEALKPIVTELFNSDDFEG